MTRALVTGTDRPTGQALVPRLVKHSIAPIAGNVASDLDGIDVLVHTADVRPGGSDSVLDAARTLATACANADVHLIYLSRVGADQSSLDHRKALWQAEQLLERTNGLAFTIQRVTHPHDALAQLMQGPWLPLPAATPVQPVSPNDIAGRIVGLMQSGPSGRVDEFGGPELMRFTDAAHIYKQVRGSVPRKVPLPRLGVIGEAVSGIHVTKTGDRGAETFREWLKSN